MGEYYRLHSYRTSCSATTMRVWPVLSLLCSKESSICRVGHLSFLGHASTACP